MIGSLFVWQVKSVQKKNMRIFLFYDLYPCRKHFLMQGFPLAGKRADLDNLVSVATDLTSSVNSQIQFVWSRAYDDKNRAAARKPWDDQTVRTRVDWEWQRQRVRSPLIKMRNSPRQSSSSSKTWQHVSISSSNPSLMSSHSSVWNEDESIFRRVKRYLGLGSSWLSQY